MSDLRVISATRRRHHIAGEGCMIAPRLELN